MLFDTKIRNASIVFLDKLPVFNNVAIHGLGAAPMAKNKNLLRIYSNSSFHLTKTQRRFHLMSRARLRFSLAPSSGHPPVLAVTLDFSCEVLTAMEHGNHPEWLSAISLILNFETKTSQTRYQH